MEGVKLTGALGAEEQKQVLPPEARTARGPVAVIECVQQIPCNPCEKACPFGAIEIGPDITQLPRLDLEKCRGCGICADLCARGALKSGILPQTNKDIADAAESAAFYETISSLNQEESRA